MNRIVREERAGDVLGVPGRFFGVVASADGLILNQRWISEARPSAEHGAPVVLRATIRFDDESGNGRESFTITGEARDPGLRGDRGFVSGGCVHDDIAATFPELAPLIRWHLCATDGPMHYVGNAVYLAGNRDHWGLLKGQAHPGPVHQETRIRFGTSPITHKVGRRLLEFIQSGRVFHVEPVEHVNRSGERYKFGPKFTFNGFPCEWHECPFDTVEQAQEWGEALTAGDYQLSTRPTLFGEGKARELDAARRVAVWPDATDEQLCAAPDVLRAALLARLPALLAEFRADVERAGFVWPADRSAT